MKRKQTEPADPVPPPRPSGAGATAHELFAAGGELGALMARQDWSATPLGPVEGWPRALVTAVRIVLTSRQPMFVWWGDQLINLYNDAYRSILGGKHPAALGQPASVVWREIWDQVGPPGRVGDAPQRGHLRRGAAPDHGAARLP